MNKDTLHHEICDAVLNCYISKLNAFLLENANNNDLLDNDVIIMILNVTLEVSVGIYYSLKQVLPENSVNFDFTRATLVNHISDAFDKIREYSPKDHMLKLTHQQLKKIIEEGQVTVMTDDGQERTITKDDVLAHKKEAQALVDKRRKERLDALSPKIITQTH